MKLLQCSTENNRSILAQRLHDLQLEKNDDEIVDFVKRYLKISKDKGSVRSRRFHWCIWHLFENDELEKNLKEELLILKPKATNTEDIFLIGNSHERNEAKAESSIETWINPALNNLDIDVGESYYYSEMMTAEEAEAFGLELDELGFPHAYDPVDLGLGNTGFVIYWDEDPSD